MAKHLAMVLFLLVLVTRSSFAREEGGPAGTAVEDPQSRRRYPIMTPGISASEEPDAVLCCRAPRDHGNTDGVDPVRLDHLSKKDLEIFLKSSSAGFMRRRARLGRLGQPKRLLLHRCCI